MLRQILFASAGLLCWSSIATAQDDAPTIIGPRYHVDRLCGNRLQAEDVEIEGFLGAPEDVHPVCYERFADALKQSGRVAEARKWRARAILRLQVDADFLIQAGRATSMDLLGRNGFENNDDAFERLRGEGGAQSVIEDAIAWEMATPRRYDMLTAIPRGSTPPRASEFQERDELVQSLPQMRALFGASQTYVIAAARAWGARQAAGEPMEAEAHFAAAARRPAREAAEAVPAHARARVTPLRTVRLPCNGYFTKGRPVGPDARRAAVVCNIGAGEYRIVDLVSGETLQRSPAPPDVLGSFAFVNGDEVTLAARRGLQRAPFWTMRADSRLAPLALPLPPGLSDTHLVYSDMFRKEESPSGRYAFLEFRRRDRTESVQAVYDLAAERLLWSEHAAYAPFGAPDRFPLLIEESGDAPMLFSIVAEEGFERINLNTGASVRAPMPVEALNAGMSFHDEGRVMFHLPELSALVDSATLTVVWRGRRDQAPARRHSYPVCEFLRDEFARRPRSLATLMGLGAPIVFDATRPAADCAVASDGRTLALIIKPFVHVYRIEPD